MATIPILSHFENYPQQVEEVLASPLSGSADLFTVLDHCAMFVCGIVEYQEEHYRLALYGRLTHALPLLHQRCAEDLPNYLIDQLIAEPVPLSNVPDCWQDASMLLDFAQALTLALSGNTLMIKISQELADLLHDMVYLLAVQLKTPFIVRT